MREAISDVADCNCSGSKEENVHEECCPCFKAEKALTATASIGSWHEARLKGAEARGVEWAICNRLGDKPQQKALALRAEAAALDKGNQTKGEG